MSPNSKGKIKWMPWKNSGLGRLMIFSCRSQKWNVLNFSYLSTWTCVININQGIFFTQSDVNQIGSLWLSCTLTKPPAKVCWSVHLPLVFDTFLPSVHRFNANRVKRLCSQSAWSLLMKTSYLQWLDGSPTFSSQSLYQIFLYVLNADTFFSLSHRYKVNAHSTMRLFFSRL